MREAESHGGVSPDPHHVLHRVKRTRELPPLEQTLLARRFRECLFIKKPTTQKWKRTGQFLMTG